MLTFLSNVPIWVFPLFILLLVVGLRATKDRKVPVAVIYALPLLGILTIRNLTAMSPPTWIWAVALLAYVVGVAFGMKLQQKWIIKREGSFAHVKGEWLTLVAMMILFTAGFANGFLNATLPSATNSAAFMALFVVLTCLPAGHFLGRTITTLRFPTH